MPGLVLDASAAVELLLGSEAGTQVSRALRDASAIGAPAHLDAEVLSALGRLVRAGEIEDSAVAPRLAELTRAPITRYPLPPLMVAAWGLRRNVTLRDALYVALARRLGATLLTADRNLARAPRLGIAITVVG